MFEALEKDDIDGILMDKYKASYYLAKRNNDRFKMFDGFDAVIPYYVAIRDSDPINELTNEGSCFDSQIEGQSVKDLLISHLQPAKVSNKDKFYSCSCSPRSPLLGAKRPGQQRRNANFQTDRTVRRHFQSVTGSSWTCTLSMI